MNDVDWRQAACKGNDPEMWVRHGASIAKKIENDRARAICRGNDEIRMCPILNECTAWAIGMLDSKPLVSTIAGWYESGSISGSNQIEVWIDGQEKGTWSIFGRKA